MAKKLTAIARAAPAQNKYVAYYRVSTRAQSDSGLGLEAQCSTVANFVKGAIVAELPRLNPERTTSERNWQQP